MKIAYVLGRFPVLSETFIGEEIRAIEALGHTIFPIALHRPDGEFQPQDRALADRTFYFSEIDAAASRRLLKRYQFKKYRAHAFIKTQHEPHIPLLVHAAQLADYAQEKDCTHVHAHFAWGAATYAIAAAKLAKLPVTFTCHGSDVYAHAHDLKSKCNAANAILAVAPALTADLQRTTRTRCHTVYCGVDMARFAPATGAQHKRWLFVGRLMDCKGVSDILMAWKSLPEEARPVLDIVGDGPDREILQTYVKEQALEAHVNFLGPKPSAWIAEHGPHYRAFISAFRQGKDGSRDTAPQVLKEAMSMALPIVTTNFIDIPAVVGKEAAMLCPPADPDVLAKAVLKLHNMPEKDRQQMGIAGRKRVEELFTLTRQAEETLAIWSKLQKKRFL